MFCPKCGEKIENDKFNYCPYCGFHIEPLRKSFINTKKVTKKVEVIKKPVVKTKPAEPPSKELKDILKPWEKKFIDSIFDKIKVSFKEYVKEEKKYYTAFVDPIDKNKPDYGAMMRFGKINDTLAFKYRKKPSRTAVDNVIKINSTAQLTNIRNVCFTLIRNNYDIPAKEKKSFSEKLEDSSKPKVAKSSHKSIIVPEKYKDELFDEHSGSDVEYYKGKRR